MPSTANVVIPPGPSSSSHRKPRFPKALLSGVQSKQPDQLAGFKQQIAQLEILQSFADDKIKALTVFAAHQDEAIALLAKRFQGLYSGLADLKTLARDVNHIVDKSEVAVATLAGEFPSLEELVSRHDSDAGFSVCTPLKEWMEQPDHIQRDLELRLRDEVMQTKPGDAEDAATETPSAPTAPDLQDPSST